MRHVTCCLALAALLSPLCAAQETATERAAARDVVQKIESLEKSLDVPAVVKRLTAPNSERDKVVARARELMEKDLLAMCDDITTHPEIGFKEKRSVQVLTDYLRAHGFEVQMGVGGLEMAFVGRWKGNNGGPNMGVILEYDALRGTKGAFHGDQHSAQGPVGIATALAMAEYLQRTKSPGSVVVFGTPGEEIMPPEAKTQMFEAGVFNGMDVVVRSHSVMRTSRPAPGFGTCCMNIDAVKYVFSGAPAHQLTSWNGRNALEGVIHLFNNIDAIRSSVRPETRIQGIITEGGAAPNVTPDRAVADIWVRYPDAVYVAQVKKMVDDAARGAALATGTKVKIEDYGHSRDGISVATLSELAFAYEVKFGATGVTPEPEKPQGYEETGSLSSAVPGVEVTTQTSNSSNHTYEMEADALQEIGHHGFTVDAETMTAVLFDFATHPDYRAAVKREFDTIRGLFDEYQAGLRKAYTVPNVAEPK